MQLVQIDNWQEYWGDGEQFLSVAQKAHANGKKSFTPEVLYNLVCMAIEKFVMAYLMKNGDLAKNHTVVDLHDALAAHLRLPDNLSEDLYFLARFQEICDLESYQIKIPQKSEIARIVAIGGDLEVFLRPYMEMKKDELV